MAVGGERRTGRDFDGGQTIIPMPNPPKSTSDFQASLGRDRGSAFAKQNGWNFGIDFASFGGDDLKPTNCGVFGDLFANGGENRAVVSLTPLTGGFSFPPLGSGVIKGTDWAYYQTLEQTESGLNMQIDFVPVVIHGTYDVAVRGSLILNDTDTDYKLFAISQDLTQKVDITPPFALPTDGSTFVYPPLTFPAQPQWILSSGSMFGRNTDFFMQIIFFGLPFGESGAPSTFFFLGRPIGP